MNNDEILTELIRDAAIQLGKIESYENRISNLKVTYDKTGRVMEIRLEIANRTLQSIIHQIKELIIGQYTGRIK